MKESRRRVLWHVITDADGHPGEGAWGQSVCRNCALVLPAVDAVVLTLRASTSAQDMLGTTSDWAGRIEQQQYTLGEGPGIHAFTQGDPMLVDDLAAASDRWPVFVDTALAAGAAAVFAFPLQLGAIALGTLDLYRRSPGSLPLDTLADAAALADLITLALLAKAEWTETVDHRAVGRDGSYHEVHIATGMLAARHGISLGDAFTRLRAHAFGDGRTVLDSARDVIARRSDLYEQEQ